MPPQRWAEDEVTRMREAGEIARNIGLKALARVLKKRLDDAVKRGIVDHTMKEKSLENALSQHWGLWPVE
jgi:hypothetical protein